MIFGALHLIALALGAILFVMFLRAERPTASPARRRRGRRGRRQRPHLPAAADPAVRRHPAAGRRALRHAPAHARRSPALTARAAHGAPSGAAAAHARPPLKAALAERRELLGLRVPAVDVRPRGLARPRPVGEQPLLEQRRLRPRVAALPAGAHPELVERPVDRAAQPRLGRVDAEVVVDEVLLERPRALLLDRAVAVGLRAELADRPPPWPDSRRAASPGTRGASCGRRSGRPGPGTSRSTR